MRNLKIGNRVTARNVATAIYTFRLPKRTFCDASIREGSCASQNAHLDDDHQEKVDMTNNIDQYDVAIVGGGMVGMALACALSSAPLTKHLNVAIVDSNPALGMKNCIKKDIFPDPRVSTVTPATISFFKGTFAELGAWDYVQQHRHAFFDKMQVWDYTGLGYTRYSARDVGKEILGCVVENKVLHSSLLSCLQDSCLRKTIYPARLTSMTLQSYPLSGESYVQPSKTASQQKHRECLAKLELTNGNSLYSKLVVGADGSKSRVREIAGLRTTGWNYSQNAVICTVEHAVENHCAWQRFLPAGPIALLPIGDRFSNIVWTLSPEEASDHKTMCEDDFVKAVNHALDYGYGPHPNSTFYGQYGHGFMNFNMNVTSSGSDKFEVPPKVVKLVSERMAFPLSLMHARDYVSNRMVLIGDSAHTVHPLAGQGVNLGFEDASALSKVIAEGIMVGSDIGELSLLKKYEMERKSANIMMMAILDGFQKAFSVDFGPFNLLRAAALQGAQHFGPLKRSIVSYATGEKKWPFLWS